MAHFYKKTVKVSSSTWTDFACIVRSSVGLFSNNILGTERKHKKEGEGSSG